MNYPMSPVIASREMTRTRQPDGVEVTITVEIGAPVQTPAEDPAGGWYATMQFSADPTNTVHVLYGEDSVQALTHALCMPGVVLPALPYANEIDFSPSPTFGFPIAPDMSGGGGPVAAG